MVPTDDASESLSAPARPLFWPFRPSSANATALIDPAEDVRYSYEMLAVTVERLARGLASIGVQPADVVSFSLPNGPDTVAMFLATTAARAAAAPLNPAYTREEFAAYLADLRPRVVLFHGHEPAHARRACHDLGIAQVEVEGEGLGRLAIAGARTPGAARTPHGDDVALLLHTSGTTGKPKSVPLRHRNLAAGAHAVAAAYRLNSDDVSHCVMPLFHVHGLVGSTLAALQAGGAVALPRRFSAQTFWRDSERHGATWYSAVPTIHQVLLRRTEDRGRGDRLRFARSCSSALAPSVHQAYEARFGIPFVEAYGMTEAAHQMASNPLPPGERRPGSVGRSAGTEIAVVDDAWQPLPSETTGEVVVRGAGVIDGYLGAPEATAASFRDGWFRTGDSGSLSPDGYLGLAGRLKELINRGGEKISPHEVESVLLAHAAVQEAVAFALPDEKYGEVVGAIVVGPQADPAALARHCAEQLASFKVPARIVVMPEIPKGPTGKVRRRLLSQAIAQ